MVRLHVQYSPEKHSKTQKPACIPTRRDLWQGTWLPLALSFPLILPRSRRTSPDAIPIDGVRGFVQQVLSAVLNRCVFGVARSSRTADKTLFVARKITGVGMPSKQPKVRQHKNVG